MNGMTANAAVFLRRLRVSAGDRGSGHAAPWAHAAVETQICAPHHIEVQPGVPRKPGQAIELPPTHPQVLRRG